MARKIEIGLYNDFNNLGWVGKNINELESLKRLQAKYLQAKVNYEVIDSLENRKKLKEAEEALIIFAISIIPNEVHDLSKEGRKRILELVSSF